MGSSGRRRAPHNCTVQGCSKRRNTSPWKQKLENGATVEIAGDCHVVETSDLQAGEVRYNPAVKTLFFGPREVIRV